MKVVVLSDTHTMRAAGTNPSRPLPPTAWPYVETADHVLHAGDVCDAALLDELASFAPVTAVAGNCDPWDVRAWGAGEETVVSLGGVEVAMVHDSGPRKGRRARLRARFPGARVVVFGHSHQPVNEDDDGLLLLNPGSPTWPRRAPFPSMAILWIDDGDVEAEVFPV
ncbi:MAG TPA: metallophosphoesterase family protein [Actinomycetota bacterium]|nr:metallophosphoesterase family protein [Actinomycetota bacterium]